MSGTNQLQLLSTELLRLSYYLSLSLSSSPFSPSLSFYTFHHRIKNCIAVFLKKKISKCQYYYLKKKEKGNLFEVLRQTVFQKGSSFIDGNEVQLLE